MSMRGCVIQTSNRVGVVLVLFLVFLVSGVASHLEGVQISNEVEFVPVCEHFLVHVSNLEYKGRQIQSNGLVYLGPNETILVDTANNEEQTRNLLALLKTRFGRDVTSAILTHSHGDRCGGVRVLAERGIPFFAQSTTRLRMQIEGRPIPEDLSGFARIASPGIVAPLYVGPGHTSDNIAVWFPRDGVLFGGCLIKSADSTNLGYVKESDLGEWGNTLHRLLERVRGVRVVVPGHGEFGGIELIRRTQELLEEK